MELLSLWNSWNTVALPLPESAPGRRVQPLIREESEAEQKHGPPNGSLEQEKAICPFSFSTAGAM